jgi:nucleoside-triphosphatase THEP1
MNKEENIIIHDGIGVMELRQLQDLSSLNRALNKDEFMEIVGVYKKAIDRLALQAEKEGIEI